MDPHSPPPRRDSQWTDTSAPSEQLPPSRIRNVAAIPLLRDRQASAIRLRKYPPQRPTPAQPPQTQHAGGSEKHLSSRSRSHSAPLGEGGGPSCAVGQSPSVSDAAALGPAQPAPGHEPARDGQRGRFRRGLTSMLHVGGARNQQTRHNEAGHGGYRDEYDANIVDILDVLDPEVATLSDITNVQNSLFVPSLGRWVNRRPTYNLTRIPHIPRTLTTASLENLAANCAGSSHRRPSEQGTPAEEEDGGPERPNVERIPSTVTDRFYAVRPQNTTLRDWDEDELDELNDHVRHMLHSRRSKFKRSLRAFGQYVRRPLGFFVTLYATLITLFGLAWVLFLIGWIYVGEKQLYMINVIDNVLVALFAVVGDGLIPWRIVDTYHMVFIARYHHLTWKLRNRMALPDLKNKNDLPSEVMEAQTQAGDVDVEAARHEQDKEELSVLTPQQQAKLDHHQAKFSNSHTFYKPHETETHYAFPLRFLVAIVVLLDCHSCFQLALGLCTWCIDYRTRPSALTATILSCSIAVNTTAGILISIGGRRTRKKDVIERMFRQELTQEAMRKIRERHEQEEKAARDAEEAERAERLGLRLEKIEEGEEGRGRNSLNLHMPRLELWRAKSDEGIATIKEKGKERRSLDLPKKSLDRVGRFDASVGGTSRQSQDNRRVPETLPEDNREGGR